MERQINWTKKCASLLKNPEEPLDESLVKFPDLLDESNMFEWAGISFGKGEIYRLYLSVKKLAESLPEGVEKLRFFGKISTRSVPYYIVEGLCSDDEDGIDEMKQEGKNGANKYSYWVSQSIESSTWVKLPNVTMEQIVKVRLFRRLFTGNLDATIPSYPPFPGTERNLLRAQIACIVGATSISPDGFFDLDDEDPPQVRPAEAEAMAERFPKSSTDLKDPESWKHHEGDLNRIGRITALPEQLDDNGDPIEAEGEPVEPAVPLDSIKPEAWTFRQCPGGVGGAAGSVVVARSLQWPGAVAIVSGRKFVNVYVGSGVSYSAKAYSPPLPAPLQMEWMPPATDEEENSSSGLIEQDDVRVDPTPPKPEGEEEEED